MNSNKGYYLPLLVLLLSCPAILLAQTYGNEWIQHDQQYLRLKVGDNGIYKLSYQELVQAGFPVNEGAPQELQLFHRGQEQAIHIEGEGDNTFDAGDFILFYGRKNDGTLDKELYLSPELQPHQYYNLYSDTTAYYLTFSPEGGVGKRMNVFSGTNTGGMSPEPYYLEQRQWLYTNNYAAGAVYGYGDDLYTYYTQGDKGEGWTGSVLAGTRNHDISLTGLTEYYTAGPAPELEMQLLGRNNLVRNTPVHVGATTAGLSLLHTASFTGPEAYTLRATAPAGSIANNQSVVRLSTAGSERLSVSYIRLRYPRRWVMGNVQEREFRLPASSAQRYVEISNVPANAVLYDISDPSNIQRIALQQTAGLVKAVLPPSGALEQVLLLSTTPKTVPAKRMRQFRQLPATGAEYIIVSHSKLMQPAGGYTNPVEEYAAYRASAAGGGYNTLTVDVQELYDQFSYGEYSPVAIRRFVRFVSQQELPKYLFLMGKGLQVQQRYYRTATWPHAGHDLVPTFGFPGGDVPYVSQLAGSGHAPAFPVGRLSVNTPADVAAYFNKIKEDEGIQEQSLWLKQLVHLSGGTTAAEARQLRAYLQNYEYIAEDPYLGGRVKTVSKTEDVVVQELNISEEVNNGARLITFFGHSSPNLIDIEIGYASDPRSGYNNKGRYSRILVNGCDAGNIFYPHFNTFGEDWVFAAERGAINFMAHSAVGYTHILNQFTSLFYQIAVRDTSFLGASIGAIQVEAVQRMMANGATDPIRIAQADQMLLQGDPAAVLFRIEEADYETNNELLAARGMNGQPLNITSDSLAIEAVVRNFGKATRDTVLVQLEYWLEGSTPRLLSALELPALYYSDTLAFRVGTDQLSGAGLSNFRITVNPGSLLPERDYTNNTASIQLVVPAGGTLNVLPQNYGVVASAEAALVAQGIDLLHPAREYHLQLDTATSFSSPALQQSQQQARTLVRWPVMLPGVNTAPSDTIVYFWNSRLATPVGAEDPSPAKSSFTYIQNGPKGWAQAHEGQFSENKLSKLEVLPGRQWKFTPLTRQLRITTFGSAAPGTDYRRVEVFMDDVQYILDNYNFCSNNTINAIQFDQNTLAAPLAQPYGAQYSQSCGRLPQIINNFVGHDVVNGDNDNYNLQRYLTGIAEGDWVLLFSIGTNNYTQWPASVKEQVQTLGVDAATLGQLANGDPMIILGRKGSAPGTASVVLPDKSAGNPPANQQTVQLETSLTGTPGIGYIESPLIGPVASWNDLAVLMKEDATDSWNLNVVGVDAQQQETQVLAMQHSGTQPLALDAAVYPYIRLRLQVVDSVRQTPPQLRFWRVGFDPLPEGVLLTHDTLKAHQVVGEGQLVRPGFSFLNVSEQTYAADSLEVQSSLFNTDRNSALQQAFKIKSPAPGDTVRFGVPLVTEQRTGKNDLLVRVNQKPATEVLLENNIFDAKAFLTVTADSLHPFIDVAFDGSYITSGEIVSPNPLISVVLRDENLVRLKQDTTGIHIYLKRQCESCTSERINLSSPAVRFYPATRQESCKIEFTPGPLEDGLYTLQVQAEDASGNKAGTRPYAINFEVISESSMTHFYPYPNPFSTSTRFVFTLTGNEVPEDLKIQIMTVSGKIIREIMKEELGPLRIGNNISQYAWNGTDEWGDQLANGVYLYRVVIGGSNASQWKHRATKGDKAFKQEFGKLYILR